MPIGLFLGFLIGAVVGVVAMAVGSARAQDGVAVRAVPRGGDRAGDLHRAADRRRDLANLITAY